MKKKSPPPHPHNFFLNTMGNPFFGMPFLGTKRSNFFQNGNYIALYQKLCSDLILDLGKCPNQKTHEIRKYLYLCVFWLGHFPRSRIESKNSLIKCYKITLLNFFSRVFSQNIAFLKMDFPLYFQQVIWVGGGHFFLIFLKKPNNPEYGQVLVVTCTKFNSVTALLSPPTPQKRVHTAIIWFGHSLEGKGLKGMFGQIQLI